MKIYSYTDSAFPAPPEFDATWPVPFLPQYASFLKNHEGAAVYLLEEEATGIVLPLQVKSLKMFRIGQLLFAPCKNADPVGTSAQKDFLTKLIQVLREKKLCQRLQQPHPMGMTLEHPENVPYCRFGTYMTDLSSRTAEELLQTFDPKYRKAVQHSIKNGGRVVFGPEVFDDFYRLYRATTGRAGIYADPPEFFKAQLKYMGDHADIAVVYDENGPVGSSFHLWSGYHSLCTHAGSGGESKLYGAMKQLHYEMMLRMKNRGVKWYDLVGVRINSTHPALQGVFRFKKGFGGELREGYLWKTEIAALPMQVFDLLIRIRNKGRKPHGDIIDQENAATMDTQVQVSADTPPD